MRRIEEMHKDKVDERILEFLRKDSRESFVEIGKKLKLSESAIRHRVKTVSYTHLTLPTIYSV